MGRRLDLQKVLEALTPNVYFQPPENVQMSYPCIVYGRDLTHSAYAGNVPYRSTLRYQVTVIDRNPDTDLFDMVVKLPMCTHTRSFKAQNLNHDVFALYF